MREEVSSPKIEMKCSMWKIEELEEELQARKNSS